MNHPAPTKFYVFAILLAAAVCLTLPIFYFGMPGGNDLPQHYRFMIGFYDAIGRGDLHPAWIGETNLGYGDAGVRFYPPLAYYIVAFFRHLASSWNTAIALAIWFWFFVGGVGVYSLAREWYSEKASLAAALVFMVMPYHVNQVYNAGLFAEFAGLAILPFCFLFVGRVIAKGGLVNIAGLSISYALLLLSHLPLAMIGSAGLLLYALFPLGRERWNVNAIARLFASIAIAAAASSFYWIRLVSELAFVKHTLPAFTDRTYDFRLNFLASVLYIPSEKYAETSLWFTDLLFAITLAMIVPSLLICFRPGSGCDRRKLLPVVSLIVLAVLLGTPITTPLWENVGPLQKIQFPWRLLGLLSLAGALITGAFFEEIQDLFRAHLRPVGIIAVGLIAAGVVFTLAQVIRPASYPERAAFESKFEAYRSDKSYECWWPVWANADAFDRRERVSAYGRETRIVNWTDYERELQINEGPATNIRVATFYYPFWNATSNGARLNLEPAEDGTIIISVPAHEQNVRLFFARPRYETFAAVVSLATWIVLALGLAGTFVRRFADRKIA